LTFSYSSIKTTSIDTKRREELEEENPLFEQRLDNALDGLEPYYLDHLKNRISKANALTIANYILSMKVETKISTNHRKGIITSLKLVSRFLDNKPFKEMTREGILTFLDSIRKSEISDPTHKWIGTYNHRLINLLRFFKWLYSPHIEPSKRQKPPAIENIPTLKRKEKSKYKPGDLWTKEEHSIFLQYCGNKRDRCYHAMAIDTSCRGNELLKLRIKDILFKNAGNHQYAEMLVNGKTGSRVLPLIVCIPYVKDWIDDHPQRANPNAHLFCGLKKNFGRALSRHAIYGTYQNYKESIFPKLSQDPDVPSTDKKIIQALLQKPWNPYIQRLYSLTEKAKILKESLLRVHAGWGSNSKMPQIYLHYFGNESSESLLEAYGIITKDQKKGEPLRPKQCPNCSEPNKPDSKFCARCRMVLTYDAYNETLEDQKKKEDDVNVLKQQMYTIISTLESLDIGSKNKVADQLIRKGMYKSID
jgi:integrase/recombinase XerD